MTNTLPTELTIDPGTITGGAVYNPATRELTWQGMMSPGDERVIVYQAAAAPALPPNYQISNETTIFYERHNLSFQQTTDVWIAAPDFTESTLTTNPAPIMGKPVTYTFTLHNSGLAAATNVSSTFFIPPVLHPITPTLTSSIGAATIITGQVQWQGAIGVGESVTISLVLTSTFGVVPDWLPAAALIDDNLTAPTLIESNTLFVAPFRRWLPIVPKS